MKVDRFVAFVVVVAVVGAALWAYAIDQRTESISTIAESAARIEAVAESTERMLSDTLEARQTPEAIAERQAVSRAVDEIGVIKALLCDLPELAEHDGCR